MPIWDDSNEEKWLPGDPPDLRSATRTPVKIDPRRALSLLTTSPVTRWPRSYFPTGPTPTMCLLLLPCIKIRSQCGARSSYFNIQIRSFQVDERRKGERGERKGRRMSIYLLHVYVECVVEQLSCFGQGPHLTFDFVIVMWKTVLNVSDSIWKGSVFLLLAFCFRPIAIWSHNRYQGHHWQGRLPRKYDFLGNVTSRELWLPGKCDFPGNVTSQKMWLGAFALWT